MPAPAKLYPAWSTLNHPGFRVHLATRQVFHEKKLFTIPGLSDYDVQLGFFPDLDYDGSYGRNWRSTLSAHVEEQPGGDVHYIDWTGATHVFGFNGAGFDSPVGCWAVLTAEPGGGWRLAHANRWTKVFDADGAWTGLDRPDGATIHLDLGEGGELVVSHDVPAGPAP